MRGQGNTKLVEAELRHCFRRGYHPSYDLESSEDHDLYILELSPERFLEIEREETATGAKRAAKHAVKRGHRAAQSLA